MRRYRNSELETHEQTDLVDLICFSLFSTICELYTVLLHVTKNENHRRRQTLQVAQLRAPLVYQSRRDVIAGPLPGLFQKTVHGYAADHTDGFSILLRDTLQSVILFRDTARSGIVFETP